MSTRCAIIAKVEEEWRGIYIHHDGYLIGVGRTLHKHYRDHAKVLLLISRGDRSSLESDPMSATAYVDRGEELHIVERGPHPSAVAHTIGEKIVYVWDGKEWFQGLKGRSLSKAIRGIDARIRWTAMDDDTANEYLANLEDTNKALLSSLKECVMELRQLHTHHYPKCEGGCPAEVYLARANEVIARAEGKT